MNNRKWRRLLCGALALCLIFGALLAELHGDAFYAAAALTGMEPEQTYLFSVDVLLSTGDSYDLITDQTFVYTPAA